ERDRATCAGYPPRINFSGSALPHRHQYHPTEHRRAAVAAPSRGAGREPADIDAARSSALRTDAPVRDAVVHFERGGGRSGRPDTLDRGEPPGTSAGSAAQGGCEPFEDSLGGPVFRGGFSGRD